MKNLLKCTYKEFISLHSMTHSMIHSLTHSLTSVTSHTRSLFLSLSPLSPSLSPSLSLSPLSISLSLSPPSFSPSSKHTLCWTSYEMKLQKLFHYFDVLHRMCNHCISSPCSSFPVHPNLQTHLDSRSAYKICQGHALHLNKNTLRMKIDIYFQLLCSCSPP